MNKTLLTLLGAGLAMTIVSLAAPERAEAQVCPRGYRWSKFARHCVRSCPRTHYFSYTEGRCRRRSRRYRRCPASHYWSYGARRCIRRATCPAGFYYSYRLARCKRLRVRCGHGSYYDVYTRKCRQRCPAGWRWSGARCVSRCSAATRWAPRFGRCVPRARARRCPRGTYWNGRVCLGSAPGRPPVARPGYVTPASPPLAHPPAGSPPPAALATGPAAMTPARFGQLRRLVKKASFASRRLAAVRQAAARNHFTCAQVVSLLGVMSFSSGRIKALRALAPKIVDRKNDFSIVGVFTFSSSKRKARKILSRYRSI
jgi:hypothetical protein